MTLRLRGMLVAAGLLACGGAAAPGATPSPEPSETIAQVDALIDRVVEGSTEGNPRVYDGVATPSAAIVDAFAPFVFSAPPAPANAAPGPQNDVFDAWSLARDRANLPSGPLVREGEPIVLAGDDTHLYAVVAMRREPPAGAAYAALEFSATVTFERAGGGLAISSFSWVPAPRLAPSGAGAAVQLDAGALAPVQRLADAIGADVPFDEAAHARMLQAFAPDPLVVSDVAPYVFTGDQAANAAVSALETQEQNGGIGRLHLTLGTPSNVVRAGDRASFVVPVSATFVVQGARHESDARWLFVVGRDAGGAYRIVAAIWSRTHVA